MQGARIVFLDPALVDGRASSRAGIRPPLGNVTEDELAIAAIPDGLHSSKRVTRLGKEYAEVVFPPPQQLDVGTSPAVDAGLRAAVGHGGVCGARAASPPATPD